MSEAWKRHYLFGRWADLGERLPEEEAAKLFDRRALEERSRLCRRTPLDTILGILERTGRLLTCPEGRYRRILLETMPGVTGYSLQGVELGLSILERLLTRRTLEGRLACLGTPRVLDGFLPLRHGRVARALPLGTVCHIAAGNIFLGSVDSLLFGMITKNVNILKVSRQDPVFPFLFLEALEEADPKGELAPFQAATYWPHDAGEVDDRVREVCDAVLLFGGEEAVRAYKQRLSPRTQVLAFGPKISFGVLLRGLDDAGLKEAAAGFAKDASLWEQRACTSCQNLFVEGEDLMDRFLPLLEEAMRNLAAELPRGALGIHEAVEVRVERELGAWREHCGQGRLVEDPHFTLLAGRGTDVIPSPLNRTLFVQAVGRAEDLLSGSLSLLDGYLSTAGIAGPDNRVQEVVEALAGLGVLRFCRAGTMGLGGDVEGAHDGRQIPLDLVRLLNREDLSPDLFGLEWRPREEREGRVLARLNALLDEARRSPFYRERLAGVSGPLDSLEEFAARVPLLEKADLVAHCPPASRDMLTRSEERSYVFASGGTTGKPRYALWGAEEFDRAGLVTGRAFRALGIRSGMRVANLLRAGALWTGFLAFNRGLEETGCQVLSLTFNQDNRDTLDFLAEFRPHGIMAMSSALLSLAETAERRGFDTPVERIFFTGEPLSEVTRRYLQKVFRCSLVASPLYGAVEIGPQGYQCPHCDAATFHLCDEWCHQEILGEEGEVVVTALERTLHPFIRYRLGDAAEWLEEPCPCGRTSPRFRLRGRLGDYVRVHFGKLHLSEVASAFGRFEELSGAFQVQVDPKEGGRTGVTFAVEALREGPWVGDPALEARALEAVLEEAAVYRDPRNRALEDLAVRVTAPGTLERVQRTGKIRRIRDGRI